MATDRHARQQKPPQTVARFALPRMTATLFWTVSNRHFANSASCRNALKCASRTDGLNSDHGSAIFRFGAAAATCAR